MVIVYSIICPCMAVLYIRTANRTTPVSCMVWESDTRNVWTCRPVHTIGTSVHELYMYYNTCTDLSCYAYPNRHEVTVKSG